MNLPGKRPTILPQQRPLVYLITDRKAFRQPPVHPPTETALQLEAIRTAVESGCKLVQIRERDLEAVELSRLVIAAIEIARPDGALVLVNDRLDVALATGADGVHLRSTSLSPATARRIATDCGRGDLLIGTSTHSIAEVIASSADTDFVVFGPVFETASKLEFGPPLGLSKLAVAVRATYLPVIAIGGINLQNFQSVLDCGAAGIAGIGLFTDRSAVATNVKELLRGAIPREPR